MSMRSARDFDSGVNPIWCPGCGHFAVLTALRKAFAHLDIPNEDIVVASGIGCSSRLPTFLKTYGIHGVHGRVLPLATGVKLGRSKTTVVAVGGDGDGFSIGGGHIAHAARRNVDIVYIVLDNSIYGMTKGQPSPTSEEGLIRKASPYGTQERPINPLLMLLSYETSFVARTFSGQLNAMSDIFVRAIQHPGFAFVQVLSPCVTFNNTYAHYREISENLPETHDETDLLASMKLAMTTDKQYLGVFYCDESRVPYSQRVESLQEAAPEVALETLFAGLRR
ncbi:MAG: 2-oxoacid:ferredoxin oxidoreductase subunit beta [Anaerolineae bacterium]|nr:2-oxoacid:ferredoxin oxidoreductase subunit beta [Anaerolineae bacterium]